MDVKNRCIEIAKIALRIYEWPEIAYIALNGAFNDDFILTISDYLFDKERDYLIDNAVDYLSDCCTINIKNEDIRYFVWLLLHPGEPMRKDR